MGAPTTHEPRLAADLGVAAAAAARRRGASSLVLACAFLPLVVWLVPIWLGGATTVANRGIAAALPVVSPVEARWAEARRAWAVDELGAGEWPAWFLHRDLGEPAPRAGWGQLLAPSRWPLWLLGGGEGGWRAASWAFEFGYVLRLVLAGAGAFLLVRWLGGGPLAAAFAANAFALAGPMLRRYHVDELDAAAAFPWVAVAAIALVRHGTRAGVVGCAAAVAAVLAGGGAAWLAGIAAVAVVVCRSAANRLGPAGPSSAVDGELARRRIQLVGAIVAGVALVGVTWWPELVASTSARPDAVDVGRGVRAHAALPPLALLVAAVTAGAGRDGRCIAAWIGTLGLLVFSAPLGLAALLALVVHVALRHVEAAPSRTRWLVIGVLAVELGVLSPGGFGARDEPTPAALDVPLRELPRPRTKGGGRIEIDATDPALTPLDTVERGLWWLSAAAAPVEASAAARDDWRDRRGVRAVLGEDGALVPFGSGPPRRPPLAFAPEDVVVVAPGSAAAAATARTALGVSPRRTALVATSDDVDGTPATRGARGGLVSLRNSESTTGRLRFAQQATRSGLLVLAFAPWPGLSVSIDDEEVRWWPCDDGLVGIVVPQGRHRLEVDCASDPTGLCPWFALAGGALLVLLLVRARRADIGGAPPS